jgi:hypothetical protein
VSRSSHLAATLLSAAVSGFAHAGGPVALRVLPSSSFTHIESPFNDGIPDQAVTIDVLLAFLFHFESGC